MERASGMQRVLRTVAHRRLLMPREAMTASSSETALSPPVHAGLASMLLFACTGTWHQQGRGWETNARRCKHAQD